MNRVGIMFAAVFALVGCREGYAWYGDAGDSGRLDVTGSDGADATGSDASDATPSDAPDATSTLGAPRQIAPLSTSTSTSHRPAFRWALVPGSDGAHVQVCADRACAVILTEFNASGTGGSPPSDLRAGMLFWRLQSRIGTTTASATSVTWEVGIGARSATGANTSWGTTLDVNGDGLADLVVGEPRAASATGNVFVYIGSATGLSSMPTTTLAGLDGINGSFGGSVASAGDVNGDGFADLVVGADGANNYTGRVYVYLGSAAGLGSTPATTLSGLDGSHGFFGGPVASAGDVNGDGFADVVVGATGVANFTGRAYVYLGSATGLGSTPATSITGLDGSQGFFGGSLASAGDLNGDGLADVVIAAASANSGVGRVYVYFGTAMGLGSTPLTSLSGVDGMNGFFGGSVASAGDVNGDGFADLVVGAYGANSGMGAAHVYLGSSTGVGTTPATSLPGLDGAAGYFGGSVASAGDVNGDGFADLVVGAYGAAGNVGRAQVYFGSTTGIGATAALALSATVADGTFGLSVASIGDLNGDDFADLVVGSNGASYVYLGTNTGPGANPTTTLSGPGAGGSFGNSVASRGDRNGDADAGVIVGAPRASGSPGYADWSVGRVFRTIGATRSLLGLSCVR